MLVGTKTADDAAIYRVSADLALIQTVDFFTPVVDDPYQFGAIAAANSLSDVYAMGGRPVMALNIVGFPRNNENAPMAVLGEILRGGAAKAREAGIDIVGGHSVVDDEPKYGLCVTGFVHPDRFWTNTGAQPNDVLVLTKPLGTGIITTALRAGTADEHIAATAIDTMARLNRDAAEAAIEIGVHACTDVTGFGLLGHLREMVAEGRVGARVRTAAVPLLPGARELAAAGTVPGGTRRNRDAVSAHVQFDAAVSDVERLLLCDAQTSGGLLFAVAPDKSNALLARLAEANVAAASIGQFVDTHAGRIEITP